MPPKLTRLSFNHSRMQELRNRHLKKGITLRDAFHMSEKQDHDRALKEIKIAKYIRRRKGVYEFKTDSSMRNPKYRYARIVGAGVAEYHTVQIEWVGEVTDETITTTPIKYQCSCGQHTHRYRYVWTMLGSSLGKHERRYPKIKNWRLKGMMCKHGLRVAMFISGGGFTLS